MSDAATSRTDRRAVNPFGRLIPRSTRAFPSGTPDHYRDTLLTMIDSVCPSVGEDDADVDVVGVATLESFLRESLPSGQLADFARDIGSRPGRAQAYVAQLIGVRQPVERLAVLLKREGGPFGPEHASTVGLAAVDVLVCVRGLLDAFEAHWSPADDQSKAQQARTVMRDKHAEFIAEWVDLQRRFWPDGSGPALRLPGSTSAQADRAVLAVDVAELGRAEERAAAVARLTSACLYLSAGAIATWILLGLPPATAELPVEIAKLSITIPLVLLARQYGKDGLEHRLTARELRYTRLQLDHFDDYWSDFPDSVVGELRVALWNRLTPSTDAPAPDTDAVDLDKVTEMIRTILGR